jgi:hypothetical protein
MGRPLFAGRDLAAQFRRLAAARRFTAAIIAGMSLARLAAQRLAYARHRPRGEIWIGMCAGIVWPTNFGGARSACQPRRACRASQRGPSTLRRGSPEGNGQASLSASPRDRPVIDEVKVSHRPSLPFAGAARPWAIGDVAIKNAGARGVGGARPKRSRLRIIPTGAQALEQTSLVWLATGNRAVSTAARRSRRLPKCLHRTQRCGCSQTRPPG